MLFCRGVQELETVQRQVNNKNHYRGTESLEQPMWGSVSLVEWVVRAIFVWSWKENARAKQKQQKNGNRAIWLVYRTDTNARGFWLVKRTLGWKNFMPENFLEINRYFALTSHCNTIGQSNNAVSILGFSLAEKRRIHVLVFASTGW